MIYCHIRLYGNAFAGDFLKDSILLSVRIDDDHVPLRNSLIEQRLLGAEVVDALLGCPIASHYFIGIRTKIECSIRLYEKIEN